MNDPHARGIRYLRRLVREMRGTLISESTVERVAGGQAGHRGVFSSKQTFTSVDDNGVEHTHEVYVTRACGCGRLLDQGCQAHGTCSRCNAVVCAACARACFACGATLCARHAWRHNPGGEKQEVYLCPAHAWKSAAWALIGGGP